MTHQPVNDLRVQELAAALCAQRRHDVAIALDFDGVCKLFTKHKHQIMFTALFLHLREFQRVPFDVFREAYEYINFRSPDYAGKERFRCVDALSRHGSFAIARAVRISSHGSWAPLFRAQAEGPVLRSGI